jgi:hypothetical protein
MGCGLALVRAMLEMTRKVVNSMAGNGTDVLILGQNDACTREDAGVKRLAGCERNAVCADNGCSSRRVAGKAQRVNCQICKVMETSRTISVGLVGWIDACLLT